MRRLFDLSDAFLGLFFPGPCGTCDAPDQAPLCLLCQDQLAALPLRADPAQGLRPLLLWLGTYKGALRGLIRGAKFGHRNDYARRLGQLLADRLDQRPGLLRSVDALVIPPVEAARQDFHPAWSAANELAERTGLPLFHQLVRRRPGAPRTRHLAGQARALHAATSLFAGRMAPREIRRVALIDDLVTTGATANRVTHLLARQGVEVAMWIALAKTPRRSPRRTDASGPRVCPHGEKVRIFLPRDNRSITGFTPSASLDGSATSW